MSVTRANVIIATLCVLVVACGHDSDEAMTSKFWRHKMSFEELRALVENDFKNVRSMDRRQAVTLRGFVRLDSPVDRVALAELGVSRDQLVRCQRMLDTLGLERWVRSPGGPVILRQAETSLWNGAMAKGYVYWPLPLEPLSPTLDGTPPPQGRPLYRQIDKNWYLYIGR